jgi:hypothetical protein
MTCPTATRAPTIAMMYQAVMSRRAIELLVGAVIVLLLALKAIDVLCFGLGYAWWRVRRATGEPSVNDAARAAMLGGVLGRLLVAVGVLAFSAPFTDFALPRFLLSPDAAAFTAVGILVLGTMSIVQAFLLGVAVRLIAPSLPR